MRIILVTPYFKAASSERQKELDECLSRNASCQYVNEIVLLIDDGHVPSISSAKLSLVHLDHRPTYRDWVDLALGYRNCIVVLANSDIYFDDSINNLATILQEPGNLVALTRYEKVGNQLIPHPNPQWSQDVWAISSESLVNKTLLNSLNMPLGVPRCDNKIVYLFKMHGWDVYNPYQFVSTTHLHESQHRSYNKQSDITVVGGVGYVYPTEQLSTPSRTDIHVWPVSSRGISSVKLNKTLDEWLAKNESKPPARRQTFVPAINAILMPVIKREIPELVRYFSSTLSPVREDASLHMFLSIDQTWSESDKHRVLCSIHASPFHDACKSVTFLDCNIPEDQSVYIRNVPKNYREMKFSHGLKTGPNRQFFESIKKVSEAGGINAVLLQEVDTVPVRRYWVDDLNSEIESKHDAIHLGCQYDGADQLNEEQIKHLNGNAIYCVGNPSFGRYIRLWESLLLEVVKHAPWKAYDSAVEWGMVNSSNPEIPYFDSMEFHELSRLYNDFVHRLPGLTNMGGVTESGQNYLFDVTNFRNTKSQTISLHCRGALPQASLICSHFDTHSLPPVLAFDGNWQYPAITEKHAFTKARELLPKGDSNGAVYFGFPWATLIDQYLHVPDDAARLRKALEQYAPALKNYEKVVTVCQHVHMLDYQDLFIDIGVTDIFWSHAVAHQTTLPQAESIRIHPFPLYPVQAPMGRVAGSREKLFTFIGAKSPSYYLTDSRNIILEKLGSDPRGIVRGRNSWHYEKVVYGHQIKKNLAAPIIDDNASSDFRDALSKSIFSLCPSGSGPNSIRLWESIAYGCIPVIMADTYLPPGDPSLWADAAVFCGEDAQSISELPDRLARMADDPSLMAHKRRALDKLSSRYGKHCFVYDVLPLFSRRSTVDSGICRQRYVHRNTRALIRMAKDAIDFPDTSSQPINPFIMALTSHVLLADRKDLISLFSSNDILNKAIFCLRRDHMSSLENLEKSLSLRGLALPVDLSLPVEIQGSGSVLESFFPNSLAEAEKSVD